MISPFSASVYPLSKQVTRIVTPIIELAERDAGAELVAA